MKISVLTVGKIKEKFYTEAINEYSKRLSRYCKLEIVQVPDEKTVENCSEIEADIVKQKEGERLLKHIPENAYVITLEIQGKQLDSVEMAKKINQLGIQGNSHIVFVIGGFSKMTFPHQLMRVILLEQIYRSFRIINNQPYHK